jgi:voltage-gated potassium channel
MIARLPLFEAMSEAEIAELTKLLYTRTYLPGTPIVRAGDTGDAMYIVAGGLATRDRGHDSDLLKEGDFFGELALLERRRHSNDVVAKTRCRLLVLDGGALARLSRRHPEAMQRIRAAAGGKRKAETAPRRKSVTSTDH